jgi:hypothetical protein
VTGTFTALAAENEVCVRGTDAANNPGESSCTAISVQLYSFKGFFAPVRMNKDNRAQAGRTVPLKWQLRSLVDNSIVKDKSVYTGLMAYPVDCTTLTGDPAAAVKQAFAGKSVVRFAGNFWILNWKTSKSLKGTFQKMFVQFSDGSKSPEVVYRFK